MSDKKLTDEELLSIASQDVVIKDRTTQNLTEVQKFIKHFKIEEGGDKLDSHLVYQIYFDWRSAIRNKKNGTKIRTRRQFNQEFQQFFKKINYNNLGTNTQHYLLNRLCFNIYTSKELDDLFWKSRRKLKEDKAKRESKKTKDKKI